MTYIHLVQYYGKHEYLGSTKRPHKHFGAVIGQHAHNTQQKNCDWLKSSFTVLCSISIAQSDVRIMINKLYMVQSSSAVDSYLTPPAV